MSNLEDLIMGSAVNEDRIDGDNVFGGLDSPAE